MSLHEAANAVFFDRQFLMPPPPKMDGDDADDSCPADDIPSPFLIGVKINIILMARCAVINICDPVPSDKPANGAADAKTPLFGEQVCVNMCQVPSLGCSIATVPRGEDSISTTTLMPSASGDGFGSGSGAGSSSASSGGDPSGVTVQESIARGVSEKLITRCQRNMKKLAQEASGTAATAAKTSKTFLCDKIVLCNCGLGLGRGISAKEGATFLSTCMSSPMLVGGIVKTVADMLRL